jgi:EmrB/QacA subfamily drug resistance transporter
MGLSRKQFYIVAAIALGTLLNPLNSTMIAVAFSRLQEDFEVTYQSISWLIASFYVASAIGQPVFGRFTDIYGPKRIFMIGLGLVTVASMLAPLSPNFGWLITFRVLQSIGSAALYPAGMSVIRSIATDNQARVLAVLSIFSSTSAGIGPFLGGVLIHYGDWQLIFLINFPFIVASLIFAIRLIPRDEERNRTAKQTMDYWGMLWFSGFIIMLLTFLLSLPQGLNVYLLVISLVMGVGLYHYQKRIDHPFIDVTFLKHNKHISLIYVQFILVNVIFYSSLFGIPSYLQDVQHFDTKTVGFIMLSIAGFGVISTPLAGWWTDRVGPRKPLIVGAVTLFMGTISMLLVQDVTHPMIIFLILSLIGFSNGFLNIALQTLLYSYVSKSETGTASGLFMTSRYLGTILSSSILALVFGVEISTGQLHWMAMACGFISVSLLFLSIRNVRSSNEV